MFNRMVAAVLALCLAACATRHPQPLTPRLTAQATLQALPAPGEYAIDGSASEVRLLVYRAGPLANLGHNHVMVNRGVTGAVRIGAGIAASSFTLSMRADGFVIDEAQARREEGEDFPGDIPEDARAGTRRNMLSNAVLNAAAFPQITVKSVSLSGALDAVNADLEISAAGHSSRISVPLALSGDAHRFIAVGSMELRQTALGLSPYSLMHGAMQVQDAIQLKFEITVPTN